ncbi:tetraacyldisaccharide 4'-kinase [Psychromonas ossibalaenae]|uniref:tetraacyldisaccharide 4'-kinase n=1 Tax=Psychromonas ossibalaenae TaxID=444922 RepID=UPI0003727953|nr:tetraacyldisaccharide 4'-kinase [Psychromonas ossibalaenae]
MGFWYRPLTWWCWFLYPLSLLFLWISRMRRLLFKAGVLKSFRSELPVIVVGNISVGGNGKTPFVLWLCEFLIEQGYKPGVISRGYGGKSSAYPLLVDDNVSGKEAGDEPLLIYKRLGIPVVVDPVRADAAAYLAKHCSVDIIITDDGLQHYALQRDIEIVIVDGVRRYGNNHLIPMGPLRETLSRLDSVDFVINNGEQKNGEITMQLQPDTCLRVDGQSGQLDFGSRVNACAAIGYPQRFFNTLTQQQFVINNSVSFADHHAFSSDDFKQFSAQLPLLMTEKDAVKCSTFAQPNWWYLPITAELPSAFKDQLLSKIKERKC